MLTIADGPEMPVSMTSLPDPFVFQGTPFAINRIILVRILATVIMLLVLGITASRAKLIPTVGGSSRMVDQRFVVTSSIR